MLRYCSTSNLRRCGGNNLYVNITRRSITSTRHTGGILSNLKDIISKSGETKDGESNARRKHAVNFGGDMKEMSELNAPKLSIQSSSWSKPPGGDNEKNEPSWYNKIKFVKKVPKLIDAIKNGDAEMVWGMWYRNPEGVLSEASTAAVAESDTELNRDMWGKYSSKPLPGFEIEEHERDRIIEILCTRKEIIDQIIKLFLEEIDAQEMSRRVGTGFGKETQKEVDGIVKTAEENIEYAPGYWGSRVVSVLKLRFSEMEWEEKAGISTKDVGSKEQGGISHDSILTLEDYKKLIRLVYTYGTRNIEHGNTYSPKTRSDEEIELVRSNYILEQLGDNVEEPGEDLEVKDSKALYERLREYNQLFRGQEMRFDKEWFNTVSEHNYRPARILSELIAIKNTKNGQTFMDKRDMLMVLELCKRNSDFQAAVNMLENNGYSGTYVDTLKKSQTEDTAKVREPELPQKAVDLDPDVYASLIDVVLNSKAPMSLQEELQYYINTEMDLHTRNIYNTIRNTIVKYKNESAQKNTEWRANVVKGIFQEFMTKYKTSNCTQQDETSHAFVLLSHGISNGNNIKTPQRSIPPVYRMFSMYISSQIEVGNVEEAVNGYEMFNILYSNKEFGDAYSTHLKQQILEQITTSLMKSKELTWLVESIINNDMTQTLEVPPTRTVILEYLSKSFGGELSFDGRSSKEVVLETVVKDVEKFKSKVAAVRTHWVIPLLSILAKDQACDPVYLEGAKGICIGVLDGISMAIKTVANIDHYYKSQQSLASGEKLFADLGGLGEYSGGYEVVDRIIEDLKQTSLQLYKEYDGLKRTTQGNNSQLVTSLVHGLSINCTSDFWINESMQIIEDQKDNLDAGLRIKLYGMIMEEGYNNNSRLGVGNTMNLVDAIKIFEEKIDFTEISNNQKLQAEIKPFIYAIVMKTYYNLGEYTQVLKIKDHILPKSFVDDDVSGKEKSNSEIDVNINTNLYVNESNSNLTSSDSGSGSYTDTDTHVGVDINNIRERSIPAAVFDMVMSSLLKVDEVIEAMQFLEKLKRYQSQQHFTVSESVYAKLLDHFGVHLSESVTAIYLIRALGTLEKRLFNNNSLIYMYQYKSTNSDSEVGNNSKSLTSDNYGMQVVNAYYYLKNINNNNSNDNNDTLSLQFYASLCFAYASTGDITMAFQTLELVLYRYQQLLSTLDNKMAQLLPSPQSLQSKASKTNPELETPANYYTLFNPQTYNYGANIDNIHNTKRSLDYMFKTLVDCCIYCDFQNDEHLFALLRSAALSQQQQRQQKNIQETIKNNGPSANTNTNANANLNANTKNNTDMDNDGDGDGDQAFNISENDIDNDNDIDNLEFVKFVEQQTLKMDFGSNNVEKYTILFSKPSVDIKTTKNPNFNLNLNLNLNLDLGFGFGFGKAGNSGSGDTKRHHKYAVDNGNGHDKFRYFYLLDGVANHIYDLTNIHKPSTQAVPDSASYSTGINGYDNHLLLITSIFEAQVRFGNYQIAVDFLLSNSGSFADNSESEKWREYAVNLLDFAAKFVDLGEPSTKLADQNSALFQLNRLTSSLPSSSLPSSSSSTSTSPSTLTL